MAYSLLGGALGGGDKKVVILEFGAKKFVELIIRTGTHLVTGVVGCRRLSYFSSPQTGNDLG